MNAGTRVVWVVPAMATLLAFAFTLLAPRPLEADDAKVDALSGARLAAMADFIAGAESLKVRISTRFDEIEEGGIKIKRAKESTVVLRRPNKLYFKSERDDGEVAEGWFDGSKLVIVPEGKNVYAEIPIAGSIDDMLDHLADNYSVDIAAADLLYSNLKEALRSDLLSGRHVGKRSFGGRSLDQFSYESNCCDWQIWIEQGDRPIPRQLVISFVSIDHDPEQIIVLEDWTFNEDVDDSKFSFSPPKSWKKIELARHAPPPID
jgi:hypothetical protein